MSTLPCHLRLRPLTYNPMVVGIALPDPELDQLFRALADATRRDIVARVLKGEEASVTTLASRYDMSFAAVQKHVAVLEDAELVTKHRQGRERIVRGNPERIARARELLTRLEDLWRARFSRLDAVLAEPDPSNPTNLTNPTDRRDGGELPSPRAGGAGGAGGLSWTPWARPPRCAL